MDSSFKAMNRHADKSARDDRKAFMCKKILRIAVGLCLFYTIFGAELDLGVCGCLKNRVINRIARPRLNLKRIKYGNKY